MAYTEIDNPSDYFETILWSSVDTSIDTLDFQPDWVWIKSRTNADTQVLFDAVRGTGKRLSSSSDAAESTRTDELTAFNSNGFTIGTGDNVNRSGHNYVGWGWKESATAGFDIITYTGNGSNRTISHNLSAIPKMILSKRLDSGNNWHVYHVGIGNTKGLYLDTTSAEVTSTQFWNDTSPTSSVYTLGIGAGMNQNSATYVNYVFADVPGYSKFGSYTGNGNDNGSYIHLGFSPALVILKQSSASGQSWQMADNRRKGYNPNGWYLRANSNDSEESSTTHSQMDLLSSGFKLRTSHAQHNASGATYIYMAFAEQPFVTSTGIPCTAR